MSEFTKTSLYLIALAAAILLVIAYARFLDHQSCLEHNSAYDCDVMEGN